MPYWKLCKNGIEEGCRGSKNVKQPPFNRHEFHFELTVWVRQKVPEKLVDPRASNTISNCMNCLIA